MEQLFAPWRMEYIGREPEAGCLFCRLRDQAPDTDRQALVLARAPGALVLLNRFPYNSGHLMVAPTAHVGSLEDLDDEATALLMRGLRTALGVLRAVMSPEGFNVGANLGQVAGAGIPGHVHLHVVPRWNGDTNFMPVLAEAKVINEHLDQTWAKLREAWPAAT
jgi:ATP adenylyltransferase